VLLVSPAALTGCGGEPDGQPATASPTPATSTTPPRPLDLREELNLVLTLDFALPPGPLTDGTVVPDVSGGGRDGVVRLSDAAEPVVTAAADADAGSTVVRFPAPCEPGAGTVCPRGIVEVPGDPVFVPGTTDFGYGARVLMTPAETSKGANVVQKGFSVGGGGQWKLQVDGVQGTPSCVLVGGGQTDINALTADVGVADGRWHDVSCLRDGDTLIIAVDGVENGTATLPAGLVVTPGGPVRVGGKNVKPDNDQFFGAVDDVFYGVSSP
jgi:hypothetical protein